MKNFGFASASALFLLSLAAPQQAAAQSSATGNYRFILDDEMEKTVAFEARSDERGGTAGQLTLTDTAKLPDTDEEEPPSRELPSELVIKASIDQLTVDKNRALMSWIVRESSHESYIGRWVQLVVQDNGRERPDQLVWRFCKPQGKGWVPSDAELEKDNGAYLRWWATDAERKDDVGIPSVNLLPEEDKGCPVLPLAAYTFADILKWDGDIVVEP